MGLVVVAPHPDDELVGTWSLAKKGKITEVLFLAEERREEALASAKEFGFQAHFLKLDDLPEVLSGKAFCPSPYEYHPDHLTALGKCLESKATIYYYSTAMNTPFVRRLRDWKEKKSALLRIYPSQASEVEANHHWYLFESIHYLPSPVLLEVEVKWLGYHYSPIASRPYLAYPHQHEFTAKLQVRAAGTNRRLEFHDLREKLARATDGLGATMSCEEMALRIWRRLRSEIRYPLRVGVCEEGGLCGWVGDLA